MIVIGLLLAGVAVAFIRESRGLLIGEGIRPETARAIRGIALTEPKVRVVGRYRGGRCCGRHLPAAGFLRSTTSRPDYVKMPSQKKTMPIDKDAPDFVTALARGLAVIRCFGKDAVNLTLAEVAERADLARPTARRFLLTLESLGYVNTDGKRFWLAPRTLDLGYAYLSSLSIWETAQPSMRAVVDALNESCSMGVLDNGEVLYVARAAPRHMMSLQVNLGSRLPAFCTSIGRVLLAGLPPAELDAFFKTGTRRPYTAHTLTDEKALRRVLVGVRQAGYALIDQEIEVGLRAIAVPIRTGSGRVAAGLSVGAHTGRVAKTGMIKTVLPVLKQRAHEIEEILLRTDHPGWLHLPARIRATT